MNIFKKLMNPFAKNKKLLLIFAALIASANAFALNDDVFNFNNTTGDFSDTTNKMEELTNFAFYALYLVGGIVLTGAAFKLKAGDIQGFAKMAAGAGVLFIIPTIMRSLNKFSE